MSFNFLLKLLLNRHFNQEEKKKLQIALEFCRLQINYYSVSTPLPDVSKLESLHLNGKYSIPSQFRNELLKKFPIEAKRVIQKCTTSSMVVSLEEFISRL